MYTLIHFANTDYQLYEKKTNPRNMSIRPADIAKLTAEGKATCMASLAGALHYPNVQDDVLPFEMHRGIDLNDCWEAEQTAQETVKKGMADIAAKNNQQTSE